MIQDFYVALINRYDDMAKLMEENGKLYGEKIAQDYLLYFKKLDDDSKYLPK